MPTTIELSDDLADKIDSHREDGETRAEFLAELLAMYETEGTFLQEGYSE